MPPFLSAPSHSAFSPGGSRAKEGSSAFPEQLFLFSHLPPSFLNYRMGPSALPNPMVPIPFWLDALCLPRCSGWERHQNNHSTNRATTAPTATAPPQRRGRTLHGNTSDPSQLQWGWLGSFFLASWGRGGVGGAGIERDPRSFYIRYEIFLQTELYTKMYCVH